MKFFSRGLSWIALPCVLALLSEPHALVSLAQDAQPTQPSVTLTTPTAPLVYAPGGQTTAPQSQTQDQGAQRPMPNDQREASAPMTPMLEFAVDETLLRQKALNAGEVMTASAGNVPEAAQSTTTARHITGKVTAGDTGLPVSNVVVTMYDSSPRAIVSTSTDRSGIFDLYDLSSTTRTVFFRVNPSGIYPYSLASEWYDNQPAFSSATPVTLTTSTTITGINFVLDKGAQITGVVQAADTGLPLAGVRVYVIDDNDTSIDYSETDAAGQYTTGGLQTGSYKLFFQTNHTSAPDALKNYVSEYFDHKSTLASATPITVSATNVITGVNVSLMRGAAITGVVTAEDTGQPLTNTRVSLLTTIGNSIDYLYTGAAGEYAFTGLQPGRYKVKFEAPTRTTSKPLYSDEYYNDKDSLSAADIISLTASTTLSSVNAQLNVAGSITGVMTALDTGRPISDGYLALYYTAPACGPFGCYGTVASTRTDAQGRYTLSATSGWYHLGYAASSYCGGYFNNASDFNHGELVQMPRSGVKTNLNVTLAPPGQISGTVRTADTGAPLNSAQVRLYSYAGGTIDATFTNVAGQYAFNGVCNGVYTVRFSPSTGASAPSTGLATPTAFAADAVIDVTTTPATIATPVPSTADSAKYMAEYYDDKPTFGSATKLYFKAPAKLTGIDAALDRGGYFIGKVTAQDTGRPLQGVAVFVDNLEYSAATTDATGAYRIGPLRPGYYKLGFNPEYGGSTEARQYAIQYYDHKPSSDEADPLFITGQKTQMVDMALDRPGTITGKISYANPVPDAIVGIQLYGVTGNYVSTVSVYPDFGGNYTRTVAPGRYKARALPYASDYAVIYYSDKPSWAAADVITVTAGLTTSNVNFVFQKGSHITGRITDSVTGEGIAYGDVSIYEANDARFITTATADALGYYTSYLALPTGSYKIRFGDRQHLPQYSGGKRTLAEAVSIPVTAPTTTMVNASLVPLSALPTHLYLPFMNRE